jgi:archaeal flagellin FlaB
MTIRQCIEEAFTGLEAAIVLVAFIIVASVFAYTVLGVGFTTTQKSQEVIHTGVVGASSTVQVVGEVYGISPNSDTVDMINLSLGLSPGGSPVDFSKTSITYSNETEYETLTQVAGLRSTSTTPGTWAITAVSGEAGSANSLLEKGEQFTISAHPTKGTPKNTVLSLEIKPGIGETISMKRTIPAAVYQVNNLY